MRGRDSLLCYSSFMPLQLLITRELYQCKTEGKKWCIRSSHFCRYITSPMTLMSWWALHYIWIMIGIFNVINKPEKIMPLSPLPYRFHWYLPLIPFFSTFLMKRMSSLINWAAGFSSSKKKKLAS